ncbi:MAG TPA: hypothetical protein VF097_08100 [Actinomycetota bacterium]
MRWTIRAATPAVAIVVIVVWLLGLLRSPRAVVVGVLDTVIVVVPGILTRLLAVAGLLAVARLLAVSRLLAGTLVRGAGGNRALGASPQRRADPSQEGSRRG